MEGPLLSVPSPPLDPLPWLRCLPALCRLAPRREVLRVVELPSASAFPTPRGSRPAVKARDSATSHTHESPRVSPARARASSNA